MFESNAFDTCPDENEFDDANDKDYQKLENVDWYIYSWKISYISAEK